MSDVTSNWTQWKSGLVMLCLTGSTEIEVGYTEEKRRREEKEEEEVAVVVVIGGGGGGRRGGGRTL